MTFLAGERALAALNEYVVREQAMVGARVKLFTGVCCINCRSVRISYWTAAVISTSKQLDDYKVRSCFFDVVSCLLTFVVFVQLHRKHSLPRAR